MDFPGTVLLVSHDRAFLDNVVTSTLVFEGQGRITEYVGGYEDWQRQRALQDPPRSAKKEEQHVRPARPVRQGPRKLSYNETRELAQLPDLIERLEGEQAQLFETLANPSTYRSDGQTVAQARSRLADLEAALASAYGRWEQLEAIDHGADASAS